MSIRFINAAKITSLALSLMLLAACNGEGALTAANDNAGVIVSPTPPTADEPTATDNPALTGVATLSWLPPTEYTDGSSLNTLAGYKIYYGTSASTLTEVINIDNAGIATYVIDNLQAGTTYYFAVTAYDSAGKESAYSAVASKTMPA